MKIIIKESEKEIKITIPYRLVFNSLSSIILPKMINKNAEIEITSKQLRLLIRELNRFKKKHRNWVLVDIEDGESGEKVVITL